MKKLFIILLLFSVSCTPIRKGIFKSPISEKRYSIDNFFSEISERNSQFRGVTGSGKIELDEGKYRWSAIFRLYVISRDSSKISIYGPLGMKVFSMFVNGKKVTFDRKTDYEAIVELLKSTDLMGATFASILSSLPIIDTQTVKIDSTNIIILKYSDLNWFYKLGETYPDSIYILDNGHLTTVIKYKNSNNLYGPLFMDIYSIVFDAHLKIYFNKKEPLL